MYMCTHYRIYNNTYVSITEDNASKTLHTHICIPTCTRTAAAHERATQQPTTLLVSQCPLAAISTAQDS